MNSSLRLIKLKQVIEFTLKKRKDATCVPYPFLFICCLYCCFYSSTIGYSSMNSP